MSDDNHEKDQNLGKAKQAADMVRLQQKAQEFQGKLTDLGNKEYQGKVQGISIKMKGDYTVLDVQINQDYYETASRSQMENAILKLLVNLRNAISNDQEMLKNELQMDLDLMKKEQNPYGTD